MNVPGGIEILHYWLMKIVSPKVKQHELLDKEIDGLPFERRAHKRHGKCSRLLVPVMEVSYRAELARLVKHICDSLSVCECRVNRFSLSQHNQNSSINAGNHYDNTYEHLLISWHRLCVWASRPFQLNCVCVCLDTHTHTV